MQTRCETAVLEGLQARRATVVVEDIGTGGPRELVVQPENAKHAHETQNRVTHALRSIGVSALPRGMEARIEDGALLRGEHDVAVAAAVAVHVGAAPADVTEGTVFAGTLTFEGKIHGPQGMTPIARLARNSERRLAASVRARQEIGWGGPVRTVLAADLGELLRALADHAAEETEYAPAMYAEAVSAKLGRAPFRNAEKERLAIAGAGHHNLALTRGQWALVRYLPALMSPPTDTARETIAGIYSVAGLGPGPGRSTFSERPLRHPHWTVSPRAMRGRSGLDGSHGDGGHAERAAPGEVTLAHEGVLTLELEELWERRAVEAACEAADSGWTKEGLPARLVLVGIGAPRTATEEAIRRRLDVAAAAGTEPGRDPDAGEYARDLMNRVRRAHEAQDRRYGEGVRNGTVSTEGLRERLRMSRGGVTALEAAGDGTKERALRLTRIARTLADMRGNETVTGPRVREAAAVAARGGR